MVRAAVAVALVLAGCQGGGKSDPALADGGGVAGKPGFGSARRISPAEVAASGSGSAVGSGGEFADTGSGSGSDAGSGSGVEEVDQGKSVRELGAIPAWQAVVDRTRYLERRKQHGVVYGVLDGDVMVPAPPEAGIDAGVPSRLDAGLVASPYVWLVDDTEGNGALAIRVRLRDDARVHPAPGDRVAIGGAWDLDDAHRWVWKADALTPLPAKSPAAPAPSSPPGHVIATGELAGSHMISVAKEGDLANFQLVGPPPAVDGDGWPVADELGNPVYALLALPGERASYGAQDLRTPDERWSLRRGVTYVVRLGHIHKHDGKPATINARSAPVRVL